MTRLCIRAVANDTDSPLRTQPGDVICMVEDDHVFNAAEMALYRIIDLPGVPQEKLVYLMEPLYLAGAADETMVAVRKRKIDLAAFPKNQRVATEKNIADVVRVKESASLR